MIRLTQWVRYAAALALGAALHVAAVAHEAAQAEPAAQQSAPPTAATAAAASELPQQDDHKLLVMLRLPPPHYRPDASYSGRYNGEDGRGARRRTAEELARAHGLTLVDDWPMPLLGVDCYVMRYADGAAADRIIELLSRDPRVEWAQQVALYQGLGGVPSSGADPLYPTQPSARLWHLAELHRVTTGRGVPVAVIDSGVDGTHPDLAGQVASSENFVDAGAVPPELHGTAVAGIIAARGGNGGILGVAPEARLMALRACWQLSDRSTRCSSFTLGKAINFAILHGAKVINLSLSGPPDRLLERLTDVALERGITVVGAVDPQAAGATFPASHPGVLAVASQSVEARPRALAVARPAGTLLAPGRDIPVTAPGARWQFVNGNSYAAAHVSGVAALLAQLQPGANAQRLRSLLSSDSANTGTIDACASISRLTRSASGAGPGCPSSCGCPCMCVTSADSRPTAHNVLP